MCEDNERDEKKKMLYGGVILKPQPFHLKGCKAKSLLFFFVYFETEFRDAFLRWSVKISLFRP